METIQTYIASLMETGKIPTCLTDEEAEGKVLQEIKLFKVSLSEYIILLFESNECLIRIKNIVEWNTIQDITDAFLNWNLYDYVKLFVEDERILKTCDSLIRAKFEEKQNEQEYRYYLMLKERYEQKQGESSWML